jgi:hypothetical protein
MTKVFISYAHEDEFYSQELDKHLSVLRRTGYIDTWTDRKIVPGEAWSNVISDELQSARIILLLVSADFLASNYCYDVELKAAIERHEKGEAVVIPIIIRFCDWKNTPFSHLQALPTDSRPVKDWEDMDEAFLNVVEGIKAAINRLANTGDGDTGIKTGLSAEEQLSALRKRALSAKDARDFRLILFDINQFKVAYPQNFEVDELEAMVKNGLAYETHTTMPTTRRRPDYNVYAPKSSPVSRIILLAALGLILAVCAWLFWRYR